MGGKSAPAPPPAVDPMGSGQMEMMMAMMQMMMQSMGHMAGPPPVPELPEAPEVEEEREVDWADRQEQLRAKVKADYAADERRKKGTGDTILTSPLLDEELGITQSLAVNPNA